MKNKLFKPLVLLVVTGLLGLTVIQLIWLKGAVEVREQRFDNNVQEALNEVSFKVQEFEYQPIIQEFITRNASMWTPHQQKECRGKITSNCKKLGNKVYHQIDVEELDTVISIEIPGQQQQMSISSYDRIDVNRSPGQVDWDVDLNIAQSPVSIMLDPNEFEQRILESQDHLNKMLYRQMFSLQPITEVVDTGKLRVSIRNCLAKRGIHTSFEFGITEHVPNNFVFASSGSSLEDLYQSPYAVQLFSGGFFESNKELMVEFPRKQSYLLSSFWLPLSSSGLFLAMVIASFLIAMNIIVKQKQLSEMKTDFINNMTHELKTPISTISLASEMLKNESIASNEVNRMKYASVIFDENKRLANQVEKVLQIAKMEKGEIELNKTESDIHQLINTTLNQFAIQVENRDGEISKNLNATHSIVRLDEMHITNVLNNLLDNAVKYTTGIPQLEVTTAEEEGMFVLTVKDNGIGMSKEELKKVFEKFYRVTGGNIHDTKGFGLGLSYAKTIVEAHNGKIQVESKLGVGSEFKIYLPFNS